jgi:hypothetical protein
MGCGSARRLDRVRRCGSPGDAAVRHRIIESPASVSREHSTKCPSFPTPDPPDFCTRLPSSEAGRVFESCHSDRYRCSRASRFAFQGRDLYGKTSRGAGTREYLASVRGAVQVLKSSACRIRNWRGLRTRCVSPSVRGRRRRGRTGVTADVEKRQACSRLRLVEAPTRFERVDLGRDANLSYIGA